MENKNPKYEHYNLWKWLAIGFIVITIGLLISAIEFKFIKNYGALYSTFLIVTTAIVSYHIGAMKRKVTDVHDVARLIANRWFEETGQELDVTKIESHTLPPNELIIHFTGDVRSFIWNFIEESYTETLTKTIDMILEEREKSEMSKKEQEHERQLNKIREKYGDEEDLL